MSDYDLELVLFINDPDLSADDITKRLGRTPSEVSRKGSRQDVPPIPRLNVWSLKSPSPPEDSTVEIQWNSFYDLVRPVKDKIHELPRTARKRIVLIVYAHTDIPGLEIPVETMRQMAEFGVPLEVSIYDWVEEN